MHLPFTTSALNHLISQNGWALPRLARFAGKSIRFDIAPFSLVCTILKDGMLENAQSETSPDAVCVIAPSLLPRLALQDENARAEIVATGDAFLLAEIFYLSRNLKWDAADDLSHITGDIVAERIVQAAQLTHQHLRDSALNFAQAVSEYWTEERPLLAKSQQVTNFMHRVDALRDDVARLEQQIKRLASGISPGKGG